MIRLFGILAGLFFSVAVLWALVTGIGPAFATLAEEGRFVEPTVEHEFHKHPKKLALQSDGVFGTWDLAQLQRGFQVYKEVCAACHGLKYVAFRDLAQLGYNEAEIKAIAAGFQVPGVDPNTGEPGLRPGVATDYFPSPYPNDIAARAANNNAIPPDLSLMTKARHGDADYIYSLLTGYSQPPAALKREFPEFATPPNTYFNAYFPNLNIAMAPPLNSAGQVTYAEGQPAPTVDQMSEDVSAFLTWTAEPKLTKRYQVGWPVLGFLLFATILAWMAKGQVWAAAKPRKTAA